MAVEVRTMNWIIPRIPNASKNCVHVLNFVVVASLEIIDN